MAFESVRGYVQLASGLGELTRARALEAAQGLLALPGMAGSTGKMAAQVGNLAEEILAAALANRENLTAIVRSEVDAAVSRLGLVPASELEGARDEVARLRAEVSRLRDATTAGAGGEAPSAAASTGTAGPARERAPHAASPRRAARGLNKAGRGPSTTAADRAGKKAAASVPGGPAVGGSRSAGPDACRGAGA